MLNAYLVKSYVKTWLFPACLLSIFWFALTFFPLIVLIEVPINPYAILYILFCNIVFSCSCLLFNWNKAFKANTIKIKLGGANIFHTQFLKTTFILLQLYVLFSIYMQLSINGITVSSYLTDFIRSNAHYLKRRYDSEIIISMFFRAGVISNYLGAALGGLLLSSFKNRLYCVILSFFPSLLFVLFYADKGTIFLAIALFYGGVLITEVYNNNFTLALPKIKLSNIFYLSTVLFFIILAFIARTAPKHGANSLSLFHIRKYFASYAFGHIYAFSDWFSYYFFNNSIVKYKEYSGNFGWYTFLAFFKVFGHNIAIPNELYIEYFKHKDVLQSNIYTMFRGLILDYTFLGSILFMYIAGFLCHILYYSMLLLKHSAISISFFIVTVGVYYTSYITSLFNSGSLYLVYIGLVLILFLNKVRVADYFNTYLHNE
jgi:oligosaccharide repeat unit polymerase